VLAMASCSGRGIGANDVEFGETLFPCGTGQSPTSTAAKGGEQVKPAAVPPSPAPPAATTLKRPVLRLPAFRQRCG
jgi:hypothetical protein